MQVLMSIELDVAESWGEFRDIQYRYGFQRDLSGMCGSTCNKIDGSCFDFGRRVLNQVQHLKGQKMAISLTP